MKRFPRELIFLFLILPFFAIGQQPGVTPAYSKKVSVRQLDSLLLEAQDLDSGPDRMKQRSEYALTLAKNEHYRRGIFHATYNIALACFYQSNFRQSYYILDTLLTSMERDSVNVNKVINYRLTKSKIYSLMAIVFQESGDYKTSMNYYFMALKLIEKTGPDYDIALIYKGLGGLNMNAGNIRKAGEYFEKAIVLIKKSADQKIQFDIYQEQYDYYKKRKEYAGALDYGMKQLEISKHAKTPYMMVIAYENLGEVYFYLGENAISSIYLKKIVESDENKQFPNILSECYAILSRLSLREGSYDKSKKYAAEALRQAEKTGRLSLKVDALLDLANSYEKTGDAMAAIRILRQYLSFRDSLIEKNNTQKVLEIQSRFDLDQVLNEKKLIENRLTIKMLENSGKNYMLAGASIIILLLGALSIILIRKYKFEKKVNAQLTKQQGVIWDQERIIQEEKEARLRMELEHKNRELVTRAMILTQENEDKIKLIKELKTIQEKLSATGNENALLVEEQIRNLRTNISSASWEDFRMYFENVYSGFYQNLEKAYPDLTPNEKKLCALLKLNLTTKEIATITSREVRSIESSRIRLRKKLQLTMETNLVTFLSQF
ncbi:MAG: hypothetical protein M0P58_10585 [Bacteroidales bacterium]|nr:hypothetical protein [Bacteroidales bacterium]